MKKKIQKSLKLNRETLVSLCHGDLREAVGALTQLATGCQPNPPTAWTCAVVHTQCVGY